MAATATPISAAPQPAATPSPTWGNEFPDEERADMQAVIDTQALVIGSQAALIRYYQQLMGLTGQPSSS